MFTADQLRAFVRVARGRSAFEQALLELTGQPLDPDDWRRGPGPTYPPFAPYQPTPGRWRKAGRNGRMIWTPPS